MQFDQLLKSIPHKFSPEEEQLLEKAFRFAEKSHSGQTRQNGQPYLSHPVAAAVILGEIFPDAVSLSAVLLHDVLEDTNADREEIQTQFGEEVTNLVDGVTKLGQVRLRGSTDSQYLENLRKMFVATSQDVRVMLIKLADRLHNMRTIAALSPDKQTKIARETLEIYAPIAGRLGIGAWKDELEDISFGIAHPTGLRNTTQALDAFLKDRKQLFADVESSLVLGLRNEGVKYLQMYGRIKRLYSLYKKLIKYEGDMSNCQDIIAFRVITNTTTDCYAALGAIHKQFQPVPDRVKDFIAMPKPNGYQSLHTNVFHKGIVVEVQIRTDIMHEQAERGIAAHWFYAESGKQSDKVSSRLAWIADLRRWQDEATDPAELLDNLKIDTFRDRIFVLTPKGDAINLPVGATPIDFAFGVHTKLGYYMAGAKVNNKMVKLSTELEQGDVVEIIKSKKPVRISPDWMRHAKTRHARSQIRQYLQAS